MGAPTTEESEKRLAWLYREYGPVIYSRCRRLLRDPSAADDATQETFVRVLRHLDKAPPDALAWIYRIATNYCLSELRSRQVRLEALPALSVPSGVRVEDALADRDLAARIVRALPEKLRAVAWLIHVDGFEQADAARVLGISQRTVVNRLAELGERARKLIRRTT